MKSLGEMAGKRCRVLGKGGKLREATIESFGVQPLMRMHLRRRNRTKTIYATAGHRWFAYAGDRSNVRKEVTTEQLRPGTKLVGMYGRGVEHHIKLSAFGIAHGIVFGDGSMNDARKSGYTNPGHIVLCGEKDAQLARWFPLSPQTPCEAGIKVSDLPRSFKERPSLKESKSYLAGWLAGYIAADGSVSSDGSVSLSCANHETLKFVRDVCYRLGIGTTGINTAYRSGFGEEKTPLHSIGFFRHTLREDMFLIEEHRARAVAAGFERCRETDTWTVDLVEMSDRVEEVFCAVVPEHAMFTLEDNILTGNCHKGCVKAGHEHWLNLLRKDRDLYMYYEGLEQEFRDFLNADVSILTDRAGDNKKKVLTLRIFRERYEEKRQLDFLFDEEFAGAFKEGVGGCGCMIDADADARPTKVAWSAEDDERVAGLVVEMGIGDNALKAIASKMGCGLGGLRARLAQLGVDLDAADKLAAAESITVAARSRRKRKKLPALA